MSSRTAPPYRRSCSRKDNKLTVLILKYNICFPKRSGHLYLFEVRIDDIVVTGWWLMTFHNAFIPQTVLFFSLGAYFSIFGFNPLTIAHNNKTAILALFVIFAFGDIISHVIIATPVNLQIHRLSLIFNIPILLLLADWCTRQGYISSLLPNAAFIVFCVHYPIVVLLRKTCISIFENASDSIHILLYFMCVIISTVLSIGFYLMLNHFFPKVKNILSGNR